MGVLKHIFFSCTFSACLVMIYNSYISFSSSLVKTKSRFLGRIIRTIRMRLFMWRTKN